MSPHGNQPTLASTNTHPITGTRKRSPYQRDVQDCATPGTRRWSIGSRLVHLFAPKLIVLLSPYPRHLLPEKLSQASKGSKRVAISALFLGPIGWQPQRFGEFRVWFRNVFIPSFARQPTVKGTSHRTSLFNRRFSNKRAAQVIAGNREKVAWYSFQGRKNFPGPTA